MAEKTKDGRISEALELLNEAAKEKKAELLDLVSTRYGSLKSALGGVAEKLSNRRERSTRREGEGEGRCVKVTEAYTRTRGRTWAVRRWDS